MGGLIMIERVKEILFDKEFSAKRNLSIDKFLVFLMLVIYPFVVIPNVFGYFYFPRFIILIAIAIAALPVLFKNREKLTGKRNIFLLLFILFMLISSILSYDKITAFFGLFGIKNIKLNTDNTFKLIITARGTGFLTYISCIILFLLTSKIKNAEKLVKYMIYACTIVALIGVLQHFGVNFVPHESFREGFPPYGTIGQHNFFATYTVFILQASMFFSIKYDSKYWLLTSSIIFAGLLVSTTRGSWIALFISLIVLGIYCIKNDKMKKIFLILISFFIVACILLPTKNWLLLKRALSIPTNISFGLQLDDSAGSQRMYIWKQVFKLIPQYWLFGIGPDNLIYKGINLGGVLVDKAHNIYLEMLVTMGIFTLTSYLLFISTFFKKWKNELGFMYFLMIITYLVQGFFNIDVIMVMPIFWIILGLSAANEKS